MRKRICLLIGMAALALSVQAAGDFGLQHVKGINSLGLRAGTGWGNTFDVGMTYNYYFHRRWSLSVEADYEHDYFKPYALYNGFRIAPGAEAMVWQATSWLYLHLNAHLLWGWDWWENRLEENAGKDNGTLLGCDLGFNLEFYAIPDLSFTLGAGQQFRHSWLKEEKYYYFTPLFQVGVRYNIR